MRVKEGRESEKSKKGPRKKRRKDGIKVGRKSRKVAKEEGSQRRKEGS